MRLESPSLLSDSQSIAGKNPTSLRFDGIGGGEEGARPLEAAFEHKVIGREGGISTGAMNMFSGGYGVERGCATLEGIRK